MSGPIAAEIGAGVFGLALEHSGDGVLPGAIMIKGPERVVVVNPSPRDHVYFSALMLWAHFAGAAAVKPFFRDPRLPGYIGRALEDAAALLP